MKIKSVMTGWYDIDINNISKIEPVDNSYSHHDGHSIIYFKVQIPRNRYDETTDCIQVKETSEEIRSMIEDEIFNNQFEEKIK